MGRHRRTAARRCTTRSIAPISSTRRNIGDPEVLLDIVGAVGPARSTRRARCSRAHASRTRSTPTGRSRSSYGVTGVPTFVAGGYGVVGAQPYETLEQFLEQVGVAKAAE